MANSISLWQKLLLGSIEEMLHKSLPIGDDIEHLEYKQDRFVRASQSVWKLILR